VPLPKRPAIQDKLRTLARRYPPAFVDTQLEDVPRIAFHLGLLATVPEGGRVADIGGGVGLFSPGAQSLGFSTVLVDDFSDSVNQEQGDALLDLHRTLGIQIINTDVIEKGVDLPEASFDAVTSFDSMEHWHHSPKRLFHSLIKALKPGGLFVLGVPNRANLRKRLAVPLGRGRWSSMEEWYEVERFRGHVREPDVRDLRHIARDLGLREPRILGRNWQGRLSPSALTRFATTLADYPLRLFPSLCSDLYLVGRR
jgi:SAM-dependent methyltransferase